MAKLKLPLTDTTVVLVSLFCTTSSLPLLRPMTVPEMGPASMGSEFELSPQATKNVSDAIASEILMAFMCSFKVTDKLLM